MKMPNYALAHSSYLKYLIFDCVLSACIGIFFDVYTIVALILA